MSVHDRSAVRMWPLYVGGFLGPFGSPVVTTMLPEMAADLNSTVGAVSTSLTAYLLPFATLMLVSGTLAERFGRRRSVAAGYVVYTIASVGCAVAPTFGLLMLCRVLQGAANAFTTPVLVAAITEAVPRKRLGRSLGLFGSMQATGQAMAPLIGGIAATFDWRYAFWGTALVSAVLAALPPENSRLAQTGSAADRWRALLNRQLGVACVVAALAFLTTLGVAVIAALYASQAFGLGPTARGLVVAVFGLSGLAAGRWLGGLMDRHGQVFVGAVMHLVLGVGAALCGLTPNVAVLVIAIGVAGAAAAGTRAAVQTLAVTSAPANPSGATSVMLACQFGGAALAPLLWVPIFLADAARGGDGGVALVACGIPAVVAAIILAVVYRTRWVRA